jgi:hypothetical protein
VTETVRAVSGRSTADKITLKNVDKIAEYYDVKFSEHEIAMGAIPNGEKSFLCYNWLLEYFDLVGDREPGRKYI